jgi:hypothetical protein
MPVAFLKFRIVVMAAKFCPQYRANWMYLWRWRFFASDADTSPWMREVLISTSSFAHAARFETEAQAKDFINRIVQKTQAFWREVQRARGSSPTIDRVIDFEK